MKNSSIFKLKRIFTSACLCIGIALLLAGCALLPGYKKPATGFDAEAKVLTVSFLDVGQGDSSLIELPDGKYVLIDGGNVADGKLIADYLKKRGINTLDLMVATHPHEDHIGGLDDVLAAVDVKKIYMPNISEEDIPTTKTYEYFLDAVIEENCIVSPAAAGDTVLSGEDYTLQCLSPSRSDIGNLNNYSVVLKLTYKDAKFIFTGDAEAEMEKEIMENGYSVAAQVIKVGHHGSSTSSCEEFLSLLKAKYAVISCGEGNKYGHPHNETMQAYADFGVATYRTDTMGTIHIFTDGSEFNVSQDKSLSLDGNDK